MIVFASSNKGKIRELKHFFGDEIVAFSDLIEPFEIAENGNSFKENAIIKSQAIYKKLPNHIIINDIYINICQLYTGKMQYLNYGHTE